MFLKEITPPFLVMLAKKLLGQRCPINDWENSVLFKAHKKRNMDCGENEIVLRDGLRLTIHPDSRNPMEFFCYIAPEMVQEMDSFIEKTEDRKRLLDIGALHGIFSLVFAHRDETRCTLSVDASPLAFARLLYNVHRHPFANIKAVECALSDRDGVLKMHYEWEHAVSAQTEDPTQRSLCVEMITGDLLCQSRQFAPDTVKIDVEGHEIRVLRGLKGTVSQYLPLIFLEVHPTRIKQEGDSIAEIGTILAPLGYLAFDLDDTPIAFEKFSCREEDFRVFLKPLTANS